MAIDLTAQVLDALSETDKPILSTDAFPSITPADIRGALARLQSREMVIFDTIDREEAILTPEAENVAANGSPEASVFNTVRAAMEGLKMSELPVCWLNCTPARLDIEATDGADWPTESRRQGNRGHRSGQGFESWLDH